MKFLAKLNPITSKNPKTSAKKKLFICVNQTTDKMLFKEKSLDKNILKQKENEVLIHTAFHFVLQDICFSYYTGYLLPSIENCLNA